MAISKETLKKMGIPEEDHKYFTDDDHKMAQEVAKQIQEQRKATNDYMNNLLSGGNSSKSDG